MIRIPARANDRGTGRVHGLRIPIGVVTKCWQKLQSLAPGTLRYGRDAAKVVVDSVRGFGLAEIMQQ